MTIYSNFFFFLALIFLSWNCTKRQSHPSQKRTTVKTFDLNTDTLRFTSGIRSILQDSEGNYWFGSHREGAARYDGKTFTYFTTEDGLTDQQVRTIQEDQDGTIWFGTASGVSSYDGVQIKDHKHLIKEQHEYDKKDDLIDLWFNAGHHQGAYRSDGEHVYYFPFPELLDETSLNSHLVTCYTKGLDGTIWLGTYAGVFGYKDTDEGLVINRWPTIITNESLGLTDGTLSGQKGYLHVRSILVDTKGRLWIGNNGLGILLKEGDTIINFSEKMNLVHPLSSRNGRSSPPGTLEHVFAITEDHKGNLWFGDRDTGAWKYDGSTMTNYTIDDRLPSQMIWQIYEDHEDNLLFAMSDGGVYLLDGEEFVRWF